jgi:hypothetical protein
MSDSVVKIQVKYFKELRIKYRSTNLAQKMV